MTNEHLDDGAISAHLDGEAGPDEAAHVASCDACAGRLAELRAAAAAIGAPVTLEPADREGAIAAALAAAAPSRVVPMRRRPRPTRSTWLAAAAAVILVLVAVPLVGGLSTSDRDEMAATDTDDGEFSASLESAAGGAGPVTVDAGDLGSIAAGDVRATVEAALGPALRAAGDGATTGEVESDVAQGRGDDGGDAAPTAGTGTGTPAPCEDRVRADFGDRLAALRLRAVATLDGEEVSVLAFDVVADEPRLQVLVLSLDGCELRQSELLAAGP
jgi:hypothetical protein